VVVVETLKEVNEDGPTFYGGIFQTRPYVLSPQGESCPHITLRGSFIQCFEALL